MNLCNKTKYTMDKAKRQIYTINCEKRRRNKHLFWYYCPECKTYHITKQRLTEMQQYERSNI